mmetsp:Transcript_30134/g.80957  ORF Transcript_30134/g.80957 Transcript_30134/m.80957 type:complete len:278 (-) Transcript_30134:406-1239(-)
MSGVTAAERCASTWTTLLPSSSTSCGAPGPRPNTRLPCASGHVLALTASLQTSECASRTRLSPDFRARWWTPTLSTPSGTPSRSTRPWTPTRSAPISRASFARSSPLPRRQECSWPFTRTTHPCRSWGSRAWCLQAMTCAHCSPLWTPPITASPSAWAPTPHRPATTWRAWRASLRTARISSTSETCARRTHRAPSSSPTTSTGTLTCTMSSASSCARRRVVRSRARRLWRYPSAQTTDTRCSTTSEGRRQTRATLPSVGSAASPSSEGSRRASSAA